MPISLCRACSKVFNSTAMFDAHRTGDFEKPIYAETDSQKKKVIGYKPHTRRCLTTEELIAAGYQVERRFLTRIREGKSSQVECEVWFDPVAREKLQSTFNQEEEREQVTSN